MNLVASFKRILTLTLCLACCACSREQTLVSGKFADDGWSLEGLKHATYTGFQIHDRPVKLKDGRWEGAPYAQDGASRPSVHFVADFYRITKMAIIGAEAAIVFLAESTGGSGTVLYLAVVEKKNGALINTATTPLGDRVQVRAVRIEKGTIAVDVLQAGRQDPACCPGELTSRMWRMQNGRLIETTEATGSKRLSLDVIAGASWKLRAWKSGEPAPGEPEITLAYENGRITGSAGCNRYFASLAAGDPPGSLKVGPPGSTRMMCPEATMTFEQRFLKQIAGVQTLGFLPGQLTLSYEMDGQRGIMRFDRIDTNL